MNKEELKEEKKELTKNILNVKSKKNKEPTMKITLGDMDKVSDDIDNTMKEAREEMNEDSKNELEIIKGVDEPKKRVTTKEEVLSYREKQLEKHDKQSSMNELPKSYIGNKDADPYYCTICCKTHCYGNFYEKHKEYRNESIIFELFVEYAERYRKIREGNRKKEVITTIENNECNESVSLDEIDKEQLLEERSDEDIQYDNTKKELGLNRF